MRHGILEWNNCLCRNFIFPVLFQMLSRQKDPNGKWFKHEKLGFKILQYISCYCYLKSEMKMYASTKWEAMKKTLPCCSTSSISFVCVFRGSCLLYMPWFCHSGNAVTMEVFLLWEEKHIHSIKCMLQLLLKGDCHLPNPYKYHSSLFLCSVSTVLEKFCSRTAWTGHVPCCLFLT